MHIAIGFGSNRGDRLGHIHRARQLLETDGRLRVIAESALLENEAVGGPAGQDDFLNGVWVVATTLGPHQVLQRCRAIEDACGRLRRIENGPRTLDLDLLLSDDGSYYDTAVLTLPHPRLHERHFVLFPLAEVAADWRHPLLRQSVAQLLAALPVEA